MKYEKAVMYARKIINRSLVSEKPAIIKRDLHDYFRKWSSWSCDYKKINSMCVI